GARGAGARAARLRPPRRLTRLLYQVAAFLSHGASPPSRKLVIHLVARQVVIAFDFVAGPDAPISPALPVARTGVRRLTPEREPCECGQTDADHRGRHRVGSDVLNGLGVGDVTGARAER